MPMRARARTKARDGFAAEGRLSRVLRRGYCAGCGRRADVGADGDVHAGEARKARADGADQPLMTVWNGVCRAWAAEKWKAKEDHDGKNDGHDADGAVLAGEKGFGAFAHGVGDDTHVGGTGVAGQNDAGEDEGGNECENS